MRFSLLYPANSRSRVVRSQQYTNLEQHGIAAELFGFSTLWLDNSSESRSEVSALRLLQHLSTATDRIDLGIVTQIPQASSQGRFLEDLRRLDDLSSGRVRLAFTGGDEPATIIAFAQRVAEALHIEYMPWLARRIQVHADDTTAAETGARGLGLLVPSSDVSFHSRNLLQARYHDARETQPGWVSQQQTITLAEPDLIRARVGQLESDNHSMIQRYEPPLAGTITEIISQLAVLQLANGVDELVCTLLPTDRRGDSSVHIIERFGRDVIPHFVSYESPHPTVCSVTVLHTRTDTLPATSAGRAHRRIN